MKEKVGLLVEDSITPIEIQENLQTKYLGQKIHYEAEVDSTNNKAKKLAAEGAEEGVLVIADQQTNGKGRLGRQWESPKGTGIWMSLVLRPSIMPQYASQLTLIAGLNMCESIKVTTGLEARIKWPNDIVVQGKKVCGILTEMNAQMEGIHYIVLGIGVNVNMKDFPDFLPHASSLAIEGKKDYIRKDIIKDFLERFEKDYTTYKEKPSLAAIQTRYESNCINLHKKVKLIKNAEEIVAEAIGITPTGALKVQYEDGTIEEVVSGEVSVRGLYGYI